MRGGPISDKTVASTFSTIYGWLGGWDTTDVPNGTYTLQSVVTDDAGNSETSPGVSVTVDNLALHTGARTLRRGHGGRQRRPRRLGPLGDDPEPARGIPYVAVVRELFVMRVAGYRDQC